MSKIIDRIASVFVIIIGSLCFMRFTVWGSTDPRELGFYLSILVPAAIILTGDLAMSRFKD
jgi:hypothetical protein